MTTTSRCALAVEAIQEKLMKAMEDEGVVFTSKLYRRGRDDGRVEGLGPLVHLFERRLRRALSDAERLSLASRLDALGAVALGDLVIDLDDAALTAWVAKLTA